MPSCGGRSGCARWTELRRAPRRGRGRRSSRWRCTCSRGSSAALEVLVVMAVLGAPVTVVEALFICAVVTVGNTVFFLLPGQWGVAESVHVLVVQSLGYPPAIGLSLALLRRIRRLAVRRAGARAATRPGGGRWRMPWRPMAPTDAGQRIVRPRAIAQDAGAAGSMRWLGVVDHGVNRPLASLDRQGGLPTRLSPNDLSYRVRRCSAWSAPGSSRGASTPQWWPARCLAQASSIVDGADGMLARARQRLHAPTARTSTCCSTASSTSSSWRASPRACG